MGILCSRVRVAFSVRQKPKDLRNHCRPLPKEYKEVRKKQYEKHLRAHTDEETMMKAHAGTYLEDGPGGGHVRGVLARVLERVEAQKVRDEARALFPVVQLRERQLAGAQRRAQELLDAALVAGGKKRRAAVGVVLHELREYDVATV